MIQELPERETPEWLLGGFDPLGPLPLAEVLSGSVFYPNCLFHGKPIQYLAGNYHSFVYADYGVTRCQSENQFYNFKGYAPMAIREIAVEELAPDGWFPLPPEIPEFSRLRPNMADQTPFYHWAILQRSRELGADHGPERFSLLYVGREGSATYRSLYVENGYTADVVAVIRPGAAGGNDIRDEDGLFGRDVLRHNHAGRPRYLINDKYHESDWNSYPHRIAELGDSLTLWKAPEVGASSDR